MTTSSTRSDPTGSPLKWRVIFCIGLALVVGLWMGTTPALDYFFGASDTHDAAGAIARRGQLGDAFGAINALFSGLAFLGILVAIRQQTEARDQQSRALELQLEAVRIQQKDLALQLEEMKATRDEMKRQADATEQQRKATLLNAAIAASLGIFESLDRPSGPFGTHEMVRDLEILANQARRELGVFQIQFPKKPLPPPTPLSVR